jgi:hypothetical protein
MAHIRDCSLGDFTSLLHEAGELARQNARPVAATLRELPAPPDA